MRKLLGFLAVTAALALALLGYGPRSAGGHGAVIRLASTAVAAGDSLGVSGEGLGSRDSVALVLEGMAGRFPLATVLGDARGRFAVTVWIPAEAPPGEYRVVATAGHDRAMSDLVVTAGAEVLVPVAHGTMEARADAFVLERRRSSLELGIAVAVLLALAAAGSLLLRTGKRSER